MEEKIPVPILQIPPEIEERQVARVRRLKAERDSEKVKEALDKLREIAERDENTFPSVLEAVNAYATLGEICDVFRGVFGEYKAPNIL